MNKFRIIFIASIILLSNTLYAQLTPQEAIGQMIRGINIGNTMENNMQGPVQEYYFDDYKSAGFECIRIPVNWGNHTSNSAPYTINSTWMNTVEKVVDWGLERGLFLIINGHHEDWLKSDYSETNKARFDSIWSQVATRFKDKSDRLLFEIINEPFGMTKAQVDDVNFRIIPIIRKTNPTRIIIYSGREYCGVDFLIEAAIPNDDYLMGYFHSYDPWDFAGEGNGTFLPKDLSDTKSRFARVDQWTKTNNIPVMVSEFGARTICEYNSRMLYYAVNVEEAIRNNVAFQAWDDGGWWRIYERESHNWDNDVKDILTKNYPDSPTALKIQADGDSLITLTWQNRTTENDKIIIQRRINNGAFIDYAELPKDAVQFIDTDLTNGNKNYYRVISSFNSSTDFYSYPIMAVIYVVPTERTPFHGTPSIIPGTIEAEDYDIGGEGLTYHDTDPTNIPGDYRPLEAVDVQKRNGDGGYHIGYIENGEWVEYTVNVEKTAVYDIKIETASEEFGGVFYFQIGDNHSTSLLVPSTGSWETTATLNAKMSLTKGEHFLRISFNTTKPFNVDRFTFQEDPASSVNEDEIVPSEFQLNQNFPNPFNPNTVISFSIPSESKVKLKIYNVLGIEVAELLNENISPGSYNVDFNAKNLSSGIYYYELVADSFSETKKMTLIK